jgi:hypothetical protein
MPPWGDLFKPDQIDALWAYVIAGERWGGKQTFPRPIARIQPPHCQRVTSCASCLAFRNGLLLTEALKTYLSA